MSARFSVIIPVAGSGPYLTQALESLRSPLVEHIFVVADSAEALEATRELAATNTKVRVLRTGQGNVFACSAGAARNVGLGAAVAESTDWVAFLDADDTVSPGYFEALGELIAQHADQDFSSSPLIHTRIMRLDQQEHDAEPQEVHPLRYRFMQGSRWVSLTDEPHMIGTSVAAAVFNRQVLATTGLRFDEGVNWSEDSDFIVRLLLACRARGVGVCAGARYLYRVGHQRSLTSAAWSAPLKYTLPFERFYLPWSQSSRPLPLWLQNQLLYELAHYLQIDRQVFSPALELPGQVRRTCAGYIEQILGKIDTSLLEGFAVLPLGLDRRQLLLARSAQVDALPYAPLTSRQVFSYAKRSWRPVQKFTYFYRGDALPAGQDVPTEVFTVQGQPVEPVTAKWVSHTLFGVEFVRERILWFEQAPSMRVAGFDLKVSPYAGTPLLLRQLAQPLAQPTPPPLGKTVERPPPLLMQAKKGLWRLKRALTSRSGQGSAAPGQVQPAQVRQVWVYADREHRAGDNAEAFYRYASAHAPQVEHVFLLCRQSPDWARLEQEGFTLVEVASAQAQELGRRASNLLVSDISAPGLAPILAALGPDQRLVFLQHGILRRDHWRWLNPRRIDLMLTTLDSETQAIVGDGSCYTLTRQEVWQLGLPRHDRLYELAAGEVRRDRVLVAPTWQQSLVTATDDEVRAWVGSWVGPWVEACERLGQRGVRPVFFVHPNMEERVAHLGEGLGVELVFGHQFQEALVRSCALVTDYSSVADDALLVGVPVALVVAPDDPQLKRARNLLETPGVTLIRPENLQELAVSFLLTGSSARKAKTLKPGKDSCGSLLSNLQGSLSLWL